MYWLCSIKWWISYRDKILKLFIKVKILFNSKKLFILIRYVPINLYVLPQKYNARLEQISGQYNYSETLELSSLTKPNRIKHEFAGSELFQYFDAFSSSVWSNRTLFYCIWIIFMSSIRSNRTRKKIEILKKFKLIRLNSIWSDIPGNF